MTPLRERCTLGGYMTETTLWLHNIQNDDKNHLRLFDKTEC
jgi:hypothetical protein